MVYILISISFIVCLFLFYRLNLYIQKLEKKLLEQIILTENLKQSMKEIIAEDFLQNDGRLRKFNMQTERDIIFNGERVSESNITI